MAGWSEEKRALVMCLSPKAPITLMTLTDYVSDQTVHGLQPLFLGGGRDARLALCPSSRHFTQSSPTSIWSTYWGSHHTKRKFEGTAPTQTSHFTEGSGWPRVMVKPALQWGSCPCLFLESLALWQLRLP